MEHFNHDFLFFTINMPLVIFTTVVVAYFVHRAAKQARWHLRGHVQREVGATQVHLPRFHLWEALRVVRPAPIRVLHLLRMS